MRLLRPHVPVEVRCRVALRQIGGFSRDGVEGVIKCNDSALGLLLVHLIGEIAKALSCEVQDLRLDHDPALGAREKIFKKGVHVGYKPDANDPEFLIYREKHAHHIKTNVRGEGAQHPDRVLIKKERRRQKLMKVGDVVKISGVRGFRNGTYKIKTMWPSRPLKSASRWPKRKFPKRRTT